MDQDIRDLRAEVAGLRVQMHDGFGELRGEVSDLRAEFRIPLPVPDALLDEVGVARLGDRQVAERLVDRVEHVLG